MKKTPTSIPFKGTPEQEAKLKAIIEERKHIDGCLMQIMQEAQEIYGYLPLEVQLVLFKTLKNNSESLLKRFTELLPSMRSSLFLPRASTTFPFVSEPLATLRERRSSSTALPRY